VSCTYFLSISISRFLEPTTMRGIKNEIEEEEEGNNDDD
jgi:hypothetical protein